MEDLLLKIIAFVIAIALLVAVHEFGHFWVARRLGVKVLRFSIGFGPALWRRQPAPDEPEYVVAAIPLGGYVKMLDEREGPVEARERHRAFNRKPLWARSAIVVAGPLFNFLFAIVAFWGVLVLGEPGLRPLIGEVQPDSSAQRAGLQVGDEVLSINGQPTPTWSLAVQGLATGSVGESQLVIRVRDAAGDEQVRIIPSSDIGDLAKQRNLLDHLGMSPERPVLPPVFGKILPDEPAELAGLQAGDRILSADGTAVPNWRFWVSYVRDRPGVTIDLVIERGGQRMQLDLTPAPHVRNEEVVGRIGAAYQPMPGIEERYSVHYRTPWGEAIPTAVARTWEYSVLTLKVIWRVLTGQASVHNLSGPITIADVAGKTASYGFVYFLKFLAIVSVSLGVLNLLPVPVLDGGHLVYLAIEGVKGSPLSEAATLHAQKVGLVLLVGLMSLAFYVDIVRVLD